MKLKHFSILFFCFFLSSFALAQTAQVTGELKENHKITLTWTGPSLSEAKSTYTDYRLDVTFVAPSGKTYVVPGYFAADGSASETSSDSGDQWRAHFMPTEQGTFTYTASFKTGTNVATQNDSSGGTATAFHGDTGSFSIGATDKSGLDFRAKGKLEYVGEHFLQWSDGDFFVKSGTNSPEVFLEYSEFDNTPRNVKRNFPARTYSAHISDWNAGDPTWQTDKGKELSVR